MRELLDGGQRLSGRGLRFFLEPYDDRRSFVYVAGSRVSSGSGAMDSYVSEVDDELHQAGYLTVYGSLTAIENYLVSEGSSLASLEEVLV